MQAITYKDIVIDGLCRVQKIRELYMQIKPNRHAEIEFYAMTEKEEYLCLSLSSGTGYRQCDVLYASNRDKGFCVFCQ